MGTGHPFKPYKRMAIITLATLLTLSVVLPSDKQMLTLTGAYVLTNAENVEGLPDTFVSAATAYLRRLEEAETGDE